MAPPLAPADLPVEGLSVAKRPEDLKNILGGTMNLEKVRTQLQSAGGRTELLKMIKEKNPNVKDVQKAAEQLGLNTEQLKKKESFLMKTLKFPIRHPFITIIAVLAALYGFNALGFKLPAAIEGLMSYVPFEKIRQIFSSAFPLGKGGATIPGGASIDLPGVTV